MKKILMAVIGVAAFALATVKVDAGQGSWESGAFTAPTALSTPTTNAYSTSTGATSYSITPGAGVALTTTANCAGTNSTTGAESLTNGWDLYDGTSWTTTQPIKLVQILTGTTNSTAGTNLQPSQLTGWQAIRPGGVGTFNSTNPPTISRWGYSSFHQ